MNRNNTGFLSARESRGGPKHRLAMIRSLFLEISVWNMDLGGHEDQQWGQAGVRVSRLAR